MLDKIPCSFTGLTTAMKIAFFFVVSVLFLFAALEYEGRLYIYFLFTILGNFLLYLGFRQDAIFFDTFIGLFFWLGFWLKLTIRVAFLDGQFRENVGSFDGSGEALDLALIASSCAFCGLISINLLRRRFWFRYPMGPVPVTATGLARFYRDYRSPVLLLFVVFFIGVSLINAWLGIYQRGTMTQTVLPYGLNGLFKWLLLFGLASGSALILHYEYVVKRSNSYLVAILVLLESFASNVSLLSRGMILNSSALGFGLLRSFLNQKINLNYRLFIVAGVVFIFLFGISVIGVNYIRSTIYHIDSDASVTRSEMVSRTVYKTNVLFIDRWVGIEGILAVSSFPSKGWALFGEALQETYVEDRLSFYDENLIESQYKNQAFEKHRFISLPGIVAFCFYPGSYVFLFLALAGAALFAVCIEYIVFKLGRGNLVLCALIGQVVAFRYSSFGYVPAQSYLLFGSIFLNIFIVYIADRMLDLWYLRKDRTSAL